MPRTLSERFLKTCPQPARLASLALLLVAVQSASGFDAKIVEFCVRNVGKPVGSGECAHLSSEALRYAGAEFMRNGMPDSPSPGDYVWGTLVKRMTRSASGAIIDSHPANKCRAGDIIQYRLAGSSRHTAVVAAVNASGYPTMVYQQNFNGQRFVTRDATNLQQLLQERGGALSIYRAKAPVDTTRTEFTLVNNAHAGNVTYRLNGSTQSIGAKNTAGGYSMWWTTAPTVTITISNQNYTISKRKAYEFYKSGTVIRLRALPL